MLYVHVSKQWCGYQCLGFLSRAQILIPAITYEGCANTIKTSTLKVDSGRKIPCLTGEPNPSQQHVRHSAALRKLIGIYPSQLHKVRTGSRVSNNLSGGNQKLSGFLNRRETAGLEKFPRAKLEWAEWMWHLSCSLCLFHVNFALTIIATAVFCWNVWA